MAPQGWLGLFLLAVCWPLNWTLPGLRTAYLFFPLWLGYILVGRAGLAAGRHVVVDALAPGVRPALHPVRAGLVAV